MFKDYWKWHKKKEEINDNKGTALFHEREVWWCALGVNVGFEQDGNGELFTRPTIILKKFNLDACLVVPLTTKTKKGRYYFNVGKAGGREAIAIISQLRFVDRKRLTDKIGTLDKKTFNSLISAVIKICFYHTQK